MIFLLFGDNIYNQNGKIDKKQLARQIFIDSVKKEQLEKIVHPYVINYILNIFEECDKKNLCDLIFLEAALIYESNFDKYLDYVIAVDADTDICVKRVVTRDQTTETEVINRLNSQLDKIKKVKKAFSPKI